MKPADTPPDHDPLAVVTPEAATFRIPGSGAKWDKISGMFQAELDLVFNGEKSASDAFAAACPKVEEELQREAAEAGACRPYCEAKRG
jgi:hypothetical protein